MECATRNAPLASTQYQVGHVVPAILLVKNVQDQKAQIVHSVSFQESWLILDALFALQVILYIQLLEDAFESTQIV